MAQDSALMQHKIWPRTRGIDREQVSVVIQGAMIYAVSFGILSVLIFATPGFFSTDDYYHARIAAEMLEQGKLALDFPWLPQTILSPERYVDHHLLFHMLLAPAVGIDVINGAKVVTTALAAGIFVAAWALLRSLGVRYATIWTFGLFGAAATFVFRMLMIRTQGASMLLLLVALIVLTHRRYAWLIVLGFLYTWLYNGFVLMLALTGMYAAATLIYERRLAWQPIGYCAAGIALGIVINPYFPQNVTFALNHVGAKLNVEESIPLGAEWSAPSGRMLLYSTTGALTATVIGLVRPYFGGRKRDTMDMTLLFITLATAAMSFNSMRFLEYWPGFALVFCAAAWGRDEEIPLRLGRWQAAFERYRHVLLPLGLAVIVVGFAAPTLERTYQLAKRQTPLEAYAGSAGWLEANTEPGTLVMAIGFNDFSRLFFFNQENTYVVGLDPTYLQYADAEKWDVFHRVGEGEIEDPARAILTTFGASYVLSARRHGDFNRRADADPNMHLVYRDNFTYVWYVSNESAAAQPVS